MNHRFRPETFSISQIGRISPELREVLARIVDDDNYLPGHPEVIVALSHEDFQIITDVLSREEKLDQTVRPVWPATFFTREMVEDLIAMGVITQERADQLIEGIVELRR